MGPSWSNTTYPSARESFLIPLYGHYSILKRWQIKSAVKSLFPFAPKPKFLPYRPDCAYVYFRNTCYHWRTTAAVAISGLFPPIPFNLQQRLFSSIQANLN